MSIFLKLKIRKYQNPYRYRMFKRIIAKWKMPTIFSCSIKKKTFLVFIDNALDFFYGSYFLLALLPRKSNIYISVVDG